MKKLTHWIVPGTLAFALCMAAVPAAASQVRPETPEPKQQSIEMNLDQNKTDLIQKIDAAKQKVADQNEAAKQAALDKANELLKETLNNSRQEREQIPTREEKQTAAPTSYPTPISAERN